MLMLQVKNNGKVIVEMDGKELVIQLLVNESGQIRLGFQGPKDFKILRESLVNK